MFLLVLLVYTTPKGLTSPEEKLHKGTCVWTKEWRCNYMANTPQTKTTQTSGVDAETSSSVKSR